MSIFGAPRATYLIEAEIIYYQRVRSEDMSGLQTESGKEAKGRFERFLNSPVGQVISRIITTVVVTAIEHYIGKW